MSEERDKLGSALRKVLESFVTSSLLLLVLAAAVAAGERDYGPGLFAGLRPGQTTKEAALKRLGKPTSEYDAYVLGNAIDFFVEFPTPQSMAAVFTQGRKTKKTVKTVHVLEYRDPEEPAKIAKLVFEGGKLWYAIVPMPPSEATPEKLESRFDRKPSVTSRTRLLGDVLSSYKVYAYPAEGVAFAQESPDEDFAFKVVFAPVTSH